MFHPILRASLLAAMVASASTLTGCASIVSGTSQVVSVETLHQSGDLLGCSGAELVLSNGTIDLPDHCEDRSERPGNIQVVVQRCLVRAGDAGCVSWWPRNVQRKSSRLPALSPI